MWTPWIIKHWWTLVERLIYRLQVSTYYLHGWGTMTIRSFKSQNVPAVAGLTGRYWKPRCPKALFRDISTWTSWRWLDKLEHLRTGAMHGNVFIRLSTGDGSLEKCRCWFHFKAISGNIWNLDEFDELKLWHALRCSGDTSTCPQHLCTFSGLASPGLSLPTNNLQYLRLWLPTQISASKSVLATSCKLL